MSNSNDPSFMKESVENAKQRMANTISGLDANKVEFFAETNRHKVGSSNDKEHLQNMQDIARAKFRK